MNEQGGSPLKLQPASRKELRRISLGVAVGSCLTLLAFALLGRYNATVLAGTCLGAGVAVFNFYYLCRSVQRAAASDETTARLVMRSSYSRRMLLTVAALAAGFIAPCFHWLATLIPLLLPRLTILVMQITGAYRPDKKKEEG